MENTTVAEWLADNPKMMGILWTIMLLLAESGSVVATQATTKAGP